MSRKTRNYDGCWTCRSRKVKCDLHRPSCHRCLKARVECAGFEIKLGWAPPLTVSDDNSMVSISGIEDETGESFQRRNVDLVKFPQSMLYETFKELNAKMNELDAKVALKGSSKWSVGPFCAYQMDILSNGIKKPIRQSKIHKLEKSRNSGQIIKATLAKRTPKSLPTKQMKISQIITDEIESNDEDLSKKIEYHSVFSKTDNSWVYFTLLDYAKLSIFVIKGSKFQINEQNMLHILYPKFFPNIDSDDWLADIQILYKLFQAETGSLRLTKLFKDLIDHIQGDLFLFNRVYMESNYFDTIVIPYINNILSEFICYDFTDWNVEDINKSEDEKEYTPKELKRNIKLGVIYLVLGLAAFKKSQVYNNPKVENYNMDDYLKLSMELRKLGITIVNYHLDEYDNNSQMLDGFEEERVTMEYETIFLLSLYLQIELDNSFSVFENFDLIFAIGDFVIKSQFKKRRMGNMAKFLIAVFKVMFIFFESTQLINLFNYSILEDEAAINYGDLNENYDLVTSDEEDTEADMQIKPRDLVVSAEYTPMSFTVSFNKNEVSGSKHAEEVHKSKGKFVPPKYLNTVTDSNSIHYMFGLPKELLDIFHEIVHLTNHKNVFEKRKVFPRNFPKICADIEDNLRDFDVLQFWKLDIVDNPTHRCVYLNVSAFQQALMVYYHRLIKQAPISTYQDIIKGALGKVKDLLEVSKKHDVRVRPLFWILLVCGSDVVEKLVQKDIESLWMQWPQYARQHNYWRSKQILYEIWKRRDVGEEFGFMDMVREWDFVLCLG